MLEAADELAAALASAGTAVRPDMHIAAAKYGGSERYPDLLGLKGA